jgi:hypothetical protein
MFPFNRRRLLVALAGLALGFGAASASADIAYFTLSAANTVGLGSGPFASVSLDRTSTTSASVTFTANTGGGYAFVDGSAAGLNVAGAFSVGTISYTCSSLTTCGTASHLPTPYTIDMTNGNVDGAGSFNLQINQNDGWGAGTETISFGLTATGSNTWASAASVLTANAKGNMVVAHVGLTPGTNTGFATVPIPAAAWLFGSGLIGLIGVARRRMKGSDAPSVA